MNKPKKLVLVDFNNMCYMVVFNKHLVEKYRGHTSAELTQAKLDELVRDSLKVIFYKIFNILEYNPGHSVDLLFAKDGYKLWRRERLYEGYKSHRKTTRDASPVDFNLVFQVFDRIWVELKNILPYRFVTLEHIEVDDIIYEAIQSEYDSYDSFQIYSCDADFVQVLRHDKVELYNPRVCEFVSPEDSEFDLFEKIIRGDKSDGIPNIYSESMQERQKSIFTAAIKGWYADKESFKDFIRQQPKEVQKHFVRNRRLIDMRFIPDDIKDEILRALKEERIAFSLQAYLQVAKKYQIQAMEEKAEMIAQ